MAGVVVFLHNSNIFITIYFSCHSFSKRNNHMIELKCFQSILAVGRWFVVAVGNCWRLSPDVSLVSLNA